MGTYQRQWMRRRGRFVGVGRGAGRNPKRARPD